MTLGRPLNDPETYAIIGAALARQWEQTKADIEKAFGVKEEGYKADKMQNEALQRSAARDSASGGLRPATSQYSVAPTA